MGRILFRWAAAAFVAGMLASACGFSGPSPVTYTAYQLTCCTKGDVDQLWQPGTAVELHWIVETVSRTTVNPTHRIVIASSLLGPFSDVITLKHAIGATHAVQGSIITMDDRYPPPTQITTFVLPADLPPGYYNLRIKWDLGDGSGAGSGSVVRVGTPTDSPSGNPNLQPAGSEVPSKALLEAKGAQAQPPASETCGSNSLQVCPDQ